MGGLHNGRHPDSPLCCLAGRGYAVLSFWGACPSPGGLAFVKQNYPLHRGSEKSRAILIPLFGGVLLLNLFVVGLLGLWQYQSWRQYRAGAYTTTENLTRTLERDIVDNISMVD